METDGRSSRVPTCPEGPGGSAAYPARRGSYGKRSRHRTPGARETAPGGCRGSPTLPSREWDSRRPLEELAIPVDAAAEALIERVTRLPGKLLPSLLSGEVLVLDFASRRVANVRCQILAAH